MIVPAQIRTKVSSATMLLCVLAAVYGGPRGGIILLSPADDEFVSTTDFFVSAHITTDMAQIRKVKVYFDNQDISASVKIVGSTVVCMPPDEFFIQPALAGPHTITITLFDSFREKIDEKTLTFYLVESDNVSDDTKDSLRLTGAGKIAYSPRELVNHGTVDTRLGYDQYVGKSSYGAFCDASGNGYTGQWRYDYLLSLNSTQDRRSQSLQRFKTAINYAKTARICFGDNWPTYNQLLLDGQRVRGIEVNLKTPREQVNFDILMGHTRRAVDPYIFDQHGLDSLGKLNPLTITHNDSIRFFEPGVYQRMLLASRLHVGSGKYFKLGVDFLKSKDDSSSISQIFLIDTVNKKTKSYKRTPKDNLGLGANGALYLWKRRITIYSHYALSFFTDNILGGASTKEEIGKTAGKNVSLAFDPQKIKTFLIVNSSTVPLPISADSTKNINNGALLNSTAFNAGLRGVFPLGTAREAFEFQYFFIGPNYISLGNEYLSANRAGFLLSEELSLFSGKIVTKADFKYYKNNPTARAKNSTATNNLNLWASFMWSSMLPGITFSIMTNNDNTEIITGQNIADQKNYTNFYGTTLFYSRKFRKTTNTASLTCNYFTSGYSIKGIENSQLPAAFNFNGSTIQAGISTTYVPLPLQTRVNFAWVGSRGNYPVTRLIPSLGLTWTFIPEKLFLNADGSYSSVNDRTKNLHDNVTVKSNLVYEISSHHSLYGEVGVFKQFHTAQLDPVVKLSWEFRY